MHSRCLEPVQELAADGAVKDPIHVLRIGEEERQVHHAHGGAEVRDWTGGGDGQVDGPNLKPFKELPLSLAELSGRKNLDDDLTITPFLYEPGELLRP